MFAYVVSVISIIVSPFTLHICSLFYHIFAKMIVGITMPDIFMND